MEGKEAGSNSATVSHSEASESVSNGSSDNARKFGKLREDGSPRQMLAHNPFQALEVQMGRWKGDRDCRSRDLGPRKVEEPAVEQEASEVVREGEESRRREGC